MSVRQAAHAGLWSTIDIVLRQAAQFGVSIALARLLMPADFGIIALLAFFSSFATVFIQGGLTMALVQRRETSHSEESAVFWCNLAAALLFGALLIAAGPAVATFYGYPVLAPLMGMATVQIVVSALGSVQTALLTRSLELRTLAKAGVASTVVGGAAGVACAAFGLGVWSLAVQITLAAAVNTLLLWWASPWRPTLRCRIADLRGLFGFGAWFSLSSILEVLFSQGFALVLGKLYGVRELGLYNRALSTQQLPTGVLSAIIGRIALPLFSARADDADALRRGLRMALGLVMFINLPMMVGVALLPDLIIDVLFGSKWLPAAPILAIVAWFGVLFPMHVLNLQAVLAQGRSRTYFQIELVKKIVGIVVIGAGSVLGIIGLAVAQLTVNVMAVFINAEPVRRSLGYGVFAQLRDLGGIILPTMVMAAVVLMLRTWIHLSPLPELAFLSLAGAVTYFALGFGLRLRSFLEAAHVARLVIERRSPAAALEA
jgi:teichuronic acid exporter